MSEARWKKGDGGGGAGNAVDAGCKGRRMQGTQKFRYAVTQRISVERQGSREDTG
jgi:hypothetical protein